MRWNTLHPTAAARVSHVEACLKDAQGPVIVTTDYMRLFAEQIRPLVRNRYVVLGTDGFGRSDARAPLRRHFEVDRNFIALAALKSLADAGSIDRSVVAEAVGALGIDASKPDPFSS